MKRVLILIVVCIVLNTFAISCAKEISFTRDDRERLIRLEEGQKSLEKQIEAVNQRRFCYGVWGQEEMVGFSGSNAIWMF